LAVALVVVAGGADDTPVRGADTPIDFNRDIRPILSENCFYCHGQDGNKRQADLRLDDRDAALAARAIVPGDPGSSSLLERVHSTDADVVMPPPSSNRKLSEEQKTLLEKWIASGAEYRKHWAFEAPVRPESPAVNHGGWVRNGIDVFVLAGLEGAGMRPLPRPTGRPSSAASRPISSASRRRPRRSMPSSPTLRPMPTRNSSTGFSQARTTAKGWRCLGSTPRATPTPTASSRMATPGSGCGAIGS
jgi:hypothetical protein